MKTTIMLAAIAVITSTALAGAAEPETPGAEFRQVQKCILLERAEKGACAAKMNGFFLAVASKASLTVKDVLRGLPNATVETIKR